MERGVNVVCGAGLLTGRLKTGSIGRRGGECVGAAGKGSNAWEGVTAGAEKDAVGRDRGGASEKGGRAVVLI